MVLAEIGYLSQKRRIDITLESALHYITNLKNVFVDPMTEQVIITAFAIDDVPELHDRIIAASASLLSAPLITNNPVIEESKSLSTIW